VNANNPPAASAYSHLLGTELDYGYRARRIVEMIESSKGPLGVEEIEAMQADDSNYTAREICLALKDLDLHPTLLEQRISKEKNKDFTDKQKKDFDGKQSEELERMQKARDMVLGWDGRMSGKSGPAALYAYVWVQLVTEIFRDQYPETEWPMKASSRAENAVHFLLQDPENRFWDDITTPERETRDEILVRAFRRGYQQLVEKAGKNPKKWRWDKIHTITFVNQTLGKSGISLIEKIFNRGPYPVGGGPTQVNAEGWDRKKPFDVLHIPSMRQIVDMADLTRTRTILPTGQSGHPGNRHYADMVDRWRKVQYQPALWDRKEIEKQSEGRLLLLPK
jgi:penicillin amidase